MTQNMYVLYVFLIFFFFYNAYIDLSDSDSVTEPGYFLANMVACRHALWQPGGKNCTN